MDYRNLAKEELKLRIAEQFFPTYDCAHRIGKIDFTVAVPALRARGPCGRQAGNGKITPSPCRWSSVGAQHATSGAKGTRPVRATSGQGEDHTGGTLCRVADASRCAPHARSIGRISSTATTSLCHRTCASVRGHSSRRTARLFARSEGGL